MLHYANLDKCFLADTAMTAIYITVFDQAANTCEFLIAERSFRLQKKRELKWDPKPREGLFMEYEEISKANRVYNIEADEVVIYRDLTFDKLTFGLLPTLPQDVIDDAGLNFDSMSINDEPITTEFK